VLFCSLGGDEIGDEDLVLLLVDSAILRGALGGELDFVLIAGVEVEGGEGEIVFAAFAIINLIYL
jgi:hypothetical protein